MKNRKLMPWVRLPTDWIQQHRLREFGWADHGADHAAALMTLIVMAHHADKETGMGDLTYDQLTDMASLSRAKVSRGLAILEQKGLVSRKGEGRSSYKLADYETSFWGKLPAAPLYSNGCVRFFSELKLRKPTDLHALKLYLLFVARRDRDLNLAQISYDKIEVYTGVDRNRIKSALTVLGVNGLVHAEHLPSIVSDYGVSNAYRLVHLDSNTHMGTRGRRLIDEDGLSQQFGS